MNIDRVTITGADDSTDPQDLLDIQNDFPFVEWGVLISEKRVNSPRYPSYGHFDKMASLGLKMSMHLCGSIAKGIIEEGKRAFMNSYFRIPGVDRIQLNYTFRDKDSNLDKQRVKSLKEFMEDMPNNKRLIFQYNEANHNTLSMFTMSGFHLLYDSSGGTGKEIDLMDIRGNLGTSYTGFSGGINPDNVRSVCERIKAIQPAGPNYNAGNTWIDMESGVRTDDKLDLDKVINTLMVCSEYVS